MATSDNNFLSRVLGVPPKGKTLGDLLVEMSALTAAASRTLPPPATGIHPQNEFRGPALGIRPPAVFDTTLVGRYGGVGFGYEVSVPLPPVVAPPRIGGLLSQSPPRALPPLPKRAAPPQAGLQQRKRMTFFSFHFDDLFRVNNVRNQVPGGESTFYDSSLWESRKLSSDDAIKRLIREGIDFTSVVCVLVGTETFSRRWCRYEIARAVIDNKGLLAVHINGLRHHRDRVPHPRGPNPLDYMAVGKMRDGTYRLFETRFRRGQATGEWFPYADYTYPVDLPMYLPEPAVDYVTPLSRGTAWYDYAAQQGFKNIGGWVDLAAARVGR